MPEAPPTTPDSPLTIPSIQPQEGFMATKTDLEKEQKERAAKYGIAVRDDGHVTKPSQYASVEDDDFADPVNYAYPMDTTAHAQAAVRYWGKQKDKSEYSEDEQKIIEARMKKLANAQGVEANFASSDDQGGPIGIQPRFLAFARNDTNRTGFADDDEPKKWREMGHKERESRLAQAAKIDPWQIQDVYDDSFVYRENDKPGNPGGLVKRSHSYQDGQITLGDPSPVIQSTDYEAVAKMAAYDLDPFDGATVHFDGDFVLRTGKVFEAGDYPDKGFFITEAELATAAANFSPVDNDLEHKRTILDGKLGRVQSVVAKGKELYATVAVPKWLHSLVGLDPIKTSLAWNRDKKRIVGNGLVLNPRIADAQLVAAFTAANQSTEGTHMPDTKKPSWFENLKAKFSKNELPDELKDFNPEAVAFNDDLPAKPDPKPASDTHTAEFAELQGLRVAQLQTHAEKFFSDALAAHKVFPAEKAALETQFKQAVQDDNAGTVCFAQDGTLNEGTRVKALRDGIAARVAYNLTSEQLADVNLVTLSANASANASEEDQPTGEGKKMSEARRKALLAKGDIKPKSKNRVTSNE